MSAALDAGLEVTALHNHFFFDEPKVYYMHIGGMGDAGNLAAGVKKIYDTVAAKRGYAVAPGVKGICQGCHMALPPQLSNVLARMESIQTCPRCSRMIYRKELLEAAPETASDAKPDAKP